MQSFSSRLTLIHCIMYFFGPIPVVLRWCHFSFLLSLWRESIGDEWRADLFNQRSLFKKLLIALILPHRRNRGLISALIEDNFFPGSNDSWRLINNILPWTKLWGKCFCDPTWWTSADWPCQKADPGTRSDQRWPRGLWESQRVPVNRVAHFSRRQAPNYHLPVRLQINGLD